MSPELLRHRAPPPPPRALARNSPIIASRTGLPVSGNLATVERMRVKDSAKSAGRRGQRLSRDGWYRRRSKRWSRSAAGPRDDAQNKRRYHPNGNNDSVPSERDPMVKSRSKISRQPVKKSKKTAARTARGGSRENLDRTKPQPGPRRRRRLPRGKSGNGSTHSAAARRRAAPACTI